ncbi:MAG TPA: DUF3108 domain-containing protein, partial [Beijerinckiaceae bacterium]
MLQSGLMRLSGGLALAAALGLAAPAAADSLKVGYSVRIIGLNIGTAGLIAELDPGRYELEVSAKLGGVAAIVTRSESAAKSTGGLAEGRVVPASYATTTSNSKETRTVRMALNGGSVRAVDINPPFDEHPSRVPVTEQHKRNILDPLSALLMPVAGSGPVLGPPACERSIPVFDGFTRFDVNLSYVGRREVAGPGYRGQVVVCAARYRPVA